MRKKHLQSWVAMSALTGFLCVSTPATAQTAPTQENRPAQDNQFNREALASFSQFLDSHREDAEQLRKQPDLVSNDEFLKSHPELQDYLQQHPGVRDQIRQDPNAFMAQEARLDRRDDYRDGDRDRDRDADRRDVADFNRFLDSHRETAEQLRRDPSRINNHEFVRSHPELQEYLEQHPAVRDQLRQDPNAFMAQEANFDRRDDYRDGDGDRDRDSDRRELANFNRFLDSHRETAEQLRRDPSQINNDEFVKSHPALLAYLQEHPGVRQEMNQDPNAFVQQEARYNHNGNGMDRDSDSRRQFAEFLGGHEDVARQLSENPSLVKNHEYMDNHPELRDYLNSHPEVQQRLTADPDNFVKSSQQFKTTTTPGAGTKTPMPDATKPKQ